jgi:hypothetical protein
MSGSTGCQVRRLNILGVQLGGPLGRILPRAPWRSEPALWTTVCTSAEVKLRLSCSGTHWHLIMRSRGPNQQPSGCKLLTGNCAASLFSDAFGPQYRLRLYTGSSLWPLNAQFVPQFVSLVRSIDTGSPFYFNYSFCPLVSWSHD